MNVLALCAGYGGIELGLDLAGTISGFTPKTVCYVEREAFAVANLVKKMEAGLLDTAPVWNNVKTFRGEPWLGKVDCVTAGFPCQPWSCAGLRRGTDDSRWLWPSIASILREVRPGLVFLENVPNLARGGIEYVLGDLAALGLDAEWDVFSAKQLGATHLRKCLFILAYTRSAKSNWLSNIRREEGSELGHPDNARPQGCGNNRQDSYQLPAWPPSPEDTDSWQQVLRQKPSLEPALCGVADGRTSWVDELRGLGNGVVPVVAAYAFIDLAGRIKY